MSLNKSRRVHIIEILEKMTMIINRMVSSFEVPCQNSGVSGGFADS